MKPIITIFLALSFSALFAQNNNSCADTSYRMRFSSPGKDFSFYTHCNTADGGTVLIGKITDTISAAISNIVVIKLNTTGGVVWKTSFQNLSGNGTYFSRIIEQSNSDIVAYGYSMFGGNVRKIIMLKLSASGLLVWSNKYELSNHFDQGDLLHPYFLSEGLNNDLLLTIGGYHYENNYDSVYALAVRIDNAGAIIWSKAFINHNNTWSMNPSGIYESNGDIIAIGHVDNIVASCAFGYLSVYAIKMNYSTGQPLNVKSYCYTYPISNSFQGGGAEERDWFNSTKLTNNRFALFGRFSTVTDKLHGYKMVFDNQLNLVQAREYNVPYSNAHRLARLTVLPDGTSHFYYLSGLSPKIYWASLDSSNRIIRQRKLAFTQSDNSAVGFLNFGYRNSETYNFSTNYRINGRRYSLFTQVQRNDPAIDSCLGTDTAFVGSNPLGISATNWTWKSIIDNPVVYTPLNLIPSDFTIDTENLCTQISRCDSLRISGPDTLCVSNNFINFTGLKNPDCNKRVLWEMNPALIDSSYQPNDSTLSIRFKMPNTGNAQTMQLFASAANCTIAKDTAEIVLLPGLNPLPPDTVVCGSINIRLTPCKWGSNYLWQNGSTDSFFMAVDTGSYTVQVETACGDIFYDTIHITKPALTLGIDKTICKGDTVVLHATPGFANYQWQSQANSISVSDSVIKVFPASTTEYNLTAQTANGCTVKDTILVNVLHSPPIHLGADTSFCEGDSLVLQAPSSFNSYQWNDGSTGSSIIANNSGTYWLKARDSNNCVSADSITILPLYSLPSFTVIPKGTLCIGETDTLNTSNSFSGYRWSGGSTVSFLPVSDTGKYWVDVIDANGCKGSDTAIITKLALPPKAFLPADTIICTGTTVELKPTQNFISYLWSNGASSPSIEIRTDGIYMLQVRDNNNCVGNDSMLVSLKNCPNKILFPSAFTPNDDNRNDIFKPFVQGRLTEYRFSVYNRWGQAVFTTTDYRKGWDGYLNGVLQNTGAFVWLCQYQFSGEEKKIEKGSMMLIR